MADGDRVLGHGGQRSDRGGTAVKLVMYAILHQYLEREEIMTARAQSPCVVETKGISHTLTRMRRCRPFFVVVAAGVGEH